MDRLLLASLSPQATYNEKQLLKAGQLGTCAAQVLKRRRKSAQVLLWVFMATLLIPVVIQLTALSFQQSDRTTGFMFIQFSFVALLQVPNLVELRSSQTRLETLIALWLLSDNDESPEEPENEAATLAQLVFGNA
ncbi:MAG: hypothetical protein V4719_25935 [Planctomycetota bacterium]